MFPNLPPTRNPVVDRALSQTRKVINAIIRNYGMPDRIHLEMARDLSRSFSERRKIEKLQKDNRNSRLEAAEHLREILGREAGSEDIYKYRLWKEQKNYCLYSGNKIEIAQLRDPLALEIDHAIPRSRSFNDSWNNKVLVFTKENRNKRNLIPYEYLKDKKDAWDRFLGLIEPLPRAKQRFISKVEVSRDAEDQWKSRHLNDTRYIAREIKSHLEENLNLLDSGRNNVRVRNGRLTAWLRWQWGLGHLKNRADDDRHHALDAILVACASENIAQTISYFSSRLENSLKRLDGRFESSVGGISRASIKNY